MPDPVVMSGIRNERVAGGLWGEPPTYKSGVNACRIYARTDSPNPAGTAHVQQTQDVSVMPSSDYAAAVWIRTFGDFGAPGDFAGMIIEQLDGSGQVIPAVTQVVGLQDSATEEYRLVSAQITTTAGTRSVRYTLQGKIACPYTEGHITFDDCLFGPAGITGSTLTGAKDSAGTDIYLHGKVVTASFEGFYYIQETDRSSGIKVLGTAEVGTLIAAYGFAQMIDGEMTFVPQRIESLSGWDVSAPMGINQRASSNVGLSPVGLYVTMWGRVDAIDGDTFTMTDGSGPGLKVYASMGAYEPEVGDYVTVTGALGSDEDGAEIIPVLRAVKMTRVAE